MDEQNLPVSEQLRIAVLRKDKEEIIKLIENGADPYADNSTALITACCKHYQNTINGYSTMITLLLSYMTDYEKILTHLNAQLPNTNGYDGANVIRHYIEKSVSEKRKEQLTNLLPEKELNSQHKI